jgi:hypothetical protein
MHNCPTRIIRIESCDECPYIGERGTGKVAFIPCCELKECRELPYTVSAQKPIDLADPTGVIPDWCPLEKENRHDDA